MKAPFVTLSPAEFLLLSLEYCQKMRDSVTMKHVVPTSDKEAPTVATHLQEEVVLPFINAGITSTTKPASKGSIPAAAAAWGLIVLDIHEMYINSLEPGGKPQELMVVKESHSLRSVMIVINNQEIVKAVVNPGSQIIAMSNSICHELEISYDPTIQLNMQSANGTIDKSLGLARNIPCHFGNITLYLQIHVICNPAYDILLGRPFEVLTQSIIKNFKNKDQIITIYDSNSGQVSMISTLP